MSIWTENPIWFRERRAWAARARRLPWWRRWRYGTLAGLWLAVTGCCLLISMVDGHRFDLTRACEGASMCAPYLMVGYLVLRSLISGGSGLVRERELQTMDTLVSSPLSTAQFVVGKWMAAVVPLLAELLWAFPIALLVGWGGYGYSDAMSPVALSRCFTFAACMTMGLTALGLLLSTRSSSSGRTATQSVMAGLLLCGGTYVVDLVLQLFSGTRYMLPFLCWVNPFTALWSAWDFWDDQHYMYVTTAVSGGLWHFTAAIYLVMAVLCGLLAWDRLRKASVR